MRLLIAAAVAASSVHDCEAVKFAKAFGSHAVLQRGVSSVVWGFDTPGTVVTTTFNGVQYTNATDAQGVWRQRLPPQTANLTPTTISATSATGSDSISDILFGDVFLCGGQSNMQFSVSAAFNATAEIAAANYPNIRVFTVGQGTGGGADPQLDLTTIEQNWTAATPASIGGDGPGNGDFQYFSAICYFFGRNIFNELGGMVPIGLVSNNWGGTCIQSWMPADLSAGCGMANQVPGLYNAMIHPYTVGPMALSGFLWSQGECNADANQTAFYACAFPQFIKEWRSEFGVPSAFFGFELLPAYIADSTFSPTPLPYERASQIVALTSDASIGYSALNVVTANGLDLGDATAPHGSVHPRNKQTVANRFVAAAMPILYGRPAQYLNPRYVGAAAVTNGKTVTVTVTFDPASVGAGGLTIIPAACPIPANATECAWQEIQTTDGLWYNATTAVTPDGNGLILTAGPIAQAGMLVKSTAGMFSPWPVVTIYNGAGLPSLPWMEPVDSAVAM